jgi:EAL domain-containing protein (putative c-di-GMP-specific phosphodiesterase class I)
LPWMRLRWPLARQFAGPVTAVALLLAICVLRFALPGTPGIMLFSVVPIAALGMMFGLRGGIAAATFATAAYFVWVVFDGHDGALEHVHHPLAFFILGLISGYYADGALWDYDLRRASANARLRAALVRQEVELFYQPIVRTSGGVLAFEGLARWRRSDGSLIPPMEFVPDAEGDERTIWQLTLHTFEIAARDAAAWTGVGEAGVAVNLAPSMLSRPELPASIQRILHRAGLPPDRLVLEVTESAVASGDASITEGLERVSRLGLGGVAIDDFGIGHSSLARLDRLPVDTLKIDRQLVTGVGRAKDHDALIRAIVELAHALDLVVIAEGVEDAQEQEMLARAGCDAIQGFHVSRPLASEALSSWVQHARAPSLGP